MKTTKTPAPQRAGTDAQEAREARALYHARKAVDAVSDDPECLRLLIAMVPLIGARDLGVL